MCDTLVHLPQFVQFHQLQPISWTVYSHRSSIFANAFNLCITVGLIIWIIWYQVYHNCTAQTNQAVYEHVHRANQFSVLDAFPLVRALCLSSLCLVGLDGLDQVRSSSYRFWDLTCKQNEGVHDTCVITAINWAVTLYITAQVILLNSLIFLKQ